MSALDELARVLGIAREYYDIAGRLRRIDDDKLRRLIDAFGHACATDAEAESSLAAIENARRRRRLPHACSSLEGEPSVTVELSWPEADRHRRLVLRLCEEAGRVSEREVLPAELAARDERTFDGERWHRTVLTMPAPQDAGYHRLELMHAGAGELLADCLLVHAPERAYRPRELDDGSKLWGLSVQLYGLRSRYNYGVGDFTDLMRLVELAAAAGAAFVGLNPLHAPAGTEHADVSPYSPSSRRFLNPLYLDVEAIAELDESEAARALVSDERFQARLRGLRAAELVDYAGVAALKHEMLERLFETFCQRRRDRDTERGRAFARFKHERADVVDFARFEALREKLKARDSDAWGWPVWPDPLKDAASPEVESFLSDKRDRIDYFVYLQWNAELQLDAAARRAEALGMPIGVYTDLALAAKHGGADSWMDRALEVEGASIGAPPDAFNPAGQDWGLPPLDPERLRAARYRPFIETLRANMRAGGALRIDHVMSLLRLFLIPAGATAAEGTYVYYDFEMLSAILALESQRNRCLVIGEDLGTVPDEVRAKLSEIGALGYRVLYFEQDESGAFKAPEDFDREALTVVSTHDLPTLAGFWLERDLEHRSELGLYPSPEEREHSIVMRAEDRARLLVALERQALAPDDADGLPGTELTDALCLAVHRYLARSASRLVGVQAEDLLGEVEQANLPGTTVEHPNWRRRLGLELRSWLEAPRVQLIFSMLAKERPAQGAEPAPATARDEAPPRRAVIPRATYRVQLNGAFRFDDLAAIVPYLDALGVSHCYCSPYLKARPGSTHGYDIIDHNALNPEIGDRADFDRLADALAARGMGQILDVVPNHMAVMGRDNAWWLDVLENGRASHYATFFDIDWQPLKRELSDKVLLPVLGDHYGNVLDDGELTLVFDAERGTFSVDYYEHRFPIDPREYPLILEPELGNLKHRMSATNPLRAQFESLITAFGKLPPRWSTSLEAREERARDRAIHTSRLAGLAAESSDIEHYIEDCLRVFNGGDAYPADLERMHRLLEAQAYRLAYWRVASDEINYRRFFDINELASLRQQNTEVFEATHALVHDLVASGKLEGLRIDHPDGLYDPRGYFRALQQQAGAAPDSGERPLYLLAEKILGHGEFLREDWPVHGTTGYEFMNLMNRWLVDPDGLRELASIEADFIGRASDYGEILYRSKRLIMQTALASELGVLADDLDRLAEQDPHTRDYGLGGLRNALLETIACFPVYRTYIVDGEVSAADEAVIDRAVNAAKALSEAADTSVFDFLRDVLLNRTLSGRSEALRERVARFVMQLQQYTSPVAAKGMEDTAFYRHARLLALNEVGGTPESPAVSTDSLHSANGLRREQWPHSMLASSTHDAKRSEDLRARLLVLSEMPSDWRRHVERWADLNEPLKRVDAEGSSRPDRVTEYFLYQTLVGAWPLAAPADDERASLTARIRTYMQKAVKEAKVHTSWINPNTEYEAALESFVDALLDPAQSAAFLEDFQAFAARVARLGLYNALGQLVLKLTCPGVPDLYQGNELWRFDLVDPDNRRPVDFARRAELLDALEHAAEQDGGAALARELFASIEDERIKLFVTWRLLSLRREHPALFERGGYRPLAVAGERADHVCAFAREHEGLTLAVGVLRHCVGLTGKDGTTLEPARLGDTAVDWPGAARRDVLYAREAPFARDAESGALRAADLFAEAPVAVFVGGA